MTHHAPATSDSRYYFLGRVDTGGDDLHYSVARMASRAADLPRWCNQKEPAIKALQAAFWIKILYDEITRLDNVRELPNWLQVVRKCRG